MGQTDDDQYMTFDDSELGRERRRLVERIVREAFEYGKEHYPEYGFCEMCGQDYGAVLRSDGHYRCSHCDTVWNG